MASSSLPGMGGVDNGVTTGATIEGVVEVENNDTLPNETMGETWSVPVAKQTVDTKEGKAMDSPPSGAAELEWLF